jgi:anti-sigma regulatory factor (Ser/Thr protein kinase)
MTGPVAVRVFPGLAEESRQAHRWVRALVVASCAVAADDAELAAAELFTNAILHTRSGAPGGKVTIAVTADGVIHVHDQGTDGKPPCAALAAVSQEDGSLPDSGRGLSIVAAICAGWGCMPAARCPAAGPDDPAAQADGCCAWCQPESWPPGRGREQRAAHADA